MTMIINNNISALNAYRNTNDVNTRVEKSMEKLSSGLRINRAGDDAAGLAISEKMRGQIKGLDMATKNAQNGISMIQTSEGALNETHAIIQRMRELAVQSANDTNTDSDREKLQLEGTQLVEELNRIAETTEFNTRTLMDGEFESDGVKFHIGANKDQSVELKFNDMKADALGLSDFDIKDGESANSAIDLVNKIKGLGYHVITDGEFRRSTWHLDFMWGFEGIEHQKTVEGNTTFDAEAAMIDDTYMTGKISVKIILL
jgi:flagellin